MQLSQWSYNKKKKQNKTKQKNKKQNLYNLLTNLSKLQHGFWLEFEKEKEKLILELPFGPVNVGTSRSGHIISHWKRFPTITIFILFPETKTNKINILIGYMKYWVKRKGKETWSLSFVYSIHSIRINSILLP